MIPIDRGEEGIPRSSGIILPMPDSEIIFSVQESPEGEYEARALGHSIFTQADTLEELKRNVREAVQCHFDAGTAPPVIRLHTVKDEVIST
jgi:hypothetical protein